MSELDTRNMTTEQRNAALRATRREQEARNLQVAKNYVYKHIDAAFKAGESSVSLFNLPRGVQESHIKEACRHYQVGIDMGDYESSDYGRILLNYTYEGYLKEQLPSTRKTKASTVGKLLRAVLYGAILIGILLTYCHYA